MHTDASEALIADPMALDDFRPVVHAEQVQRLKLRGMKFSRVPGVKESIVTPNVGSLLQNA